MDSVGSLLKVPSSREDELETRAILDLSTSCGLRCPGPAGIEPATTMPLQVPGTEDEGRTPTSASADEAASASRQGQAIRQTKTNSLFQSDRAEQLSTPSPEGRSRFLRPALPHWTVLARKCARRPCDWPKGAPSPLIGPEGRGRHLG